MLINAINKICNLKYNGYSYNISLFKIKKKGYKILKEI